MFTARLSVERLKTAVGPLSTVGVIVTVRVTTPAKLVLCTTTVTLRAEPAARLRCAGFTETEKSPTTADEATVKDRLVV